MINSFVGSSAVGASAEVIIDPRLEHFGMRPQPLPQSAPFGFQFSGCHLLNDHAVTMPWRSSAVELVRARFSAILCPVVATFVSV